MPRHRPLRQPRSTFRSAGLPLASGILMLAVLYLLIDWAGNADTWRWLVQKPPSAAVEGDRSDLPRSGPKGASHKSDLSPLPLPEATGPTDEDPDEAETAQEEFQAITDGTLTLGPEEMEAYYRLLSWVHSQSFARLRQRARSDLLYTNFYDEPDKYRGQLVTMDLDVRQVIDAGDKNRLGLHLYEVWGKTTQSWSRLYVAIVVDYPKGMPVGSSLNETARFAGYFLKLQGYLPYKAKPGATPEKAPLLLGRLEWTPPAPPPAEQSQQLLWGGSIDTLVVVTVVALVGLVLAIWFVYLRRRGRKASPPHLAMSPSGEVIPIDRWLEQRGLNADNEEGGSREDDDQ